MDPISMLIDSLVGATSGAAGTAATAGDAAAGGAQSLAGGAQSAAGLGGATPPVTSASPIITPASGGAMGAAPASKSWLEQGADALNAAKTSPLGKVLGAIKPAAPAQTQWQGGFHGPTVHQGAITPSHAATTYATLAGANKRPPTLGQLLAESPLGQLRSR